jgi:hypothetical protein
MLVSEEQEIQIDKQNSPHQFSADFRQKWPTYDDPLLTAYVNEVAQRLVAEECEEKGLSFGVRVIKSPLLNAFAYPDGFVNVHAGISAKMENEGQLAVPGLMYYKKGGKEQPGNIWKVTLLLPPRQRIEDFLFDGRVSNGSAFLSKDQVDSSRAILIILHLDRN